MKVMYRRLALGFLTWMIGGTGLLSPCALAARTYIATWDNDGQTDIYGNAGGICGEAACQPDDIIVLPAGTTNDFVYIRYMHGTSGHPIVIRNADNGAAGGGTVIDTEFDTNPANMRYYACMKVAESTYCKLDGSGDPDVTYGIKLINNTHRGLWMAVDISDLEIQYIEIEDIYQDIDTGGVGIKLSSTNGFPVENTKIHNCHIDTTRTEGMYLGNAPSPLLTAPDCNGILSNLEVYDNLIENSGLDAIDVKCATGGVKIYNNTILYAGYLAPQVKPSDNEGITLSAGNVATVYNNFINEAKGCGIQVRTGVSGQDIYNNVVIDADIGILGNPDMEGLVGYTTVRYNTIINPAASGYGIYFGAAADGEIRDNLIINENSATAIVSGGVAGGDVLGNVVKATVAECNFKDAGRFDFDLTSSTPFINLGKSTDYPSTDFLGRGRPQE